jgi:enamine deaminase RidA (YjgF/YER057c/UK114 family)
MILPLVRRPFPAEAIAVQARPQLARFARGLKQDGIAHRARRMVRRGDNFKRRFPMQIRTWILAATVAGLASAAQAQEINRVVASPNALFSSVVAVPPGYTLYFVSGALPTPVTPPANGQPANWGDSTQQTQSVLNNLKASMAKAGLTFGDVVKATAFMGPDLDFQAMNKVWQTEFGTPAQPNKPARAAFHVHALAAPGAQLEIEFIAAKK